MIITAWILLIVSIIFIFTHIMTVRHVEQLNKRTVLTKYTVNQSSFIKFYISIIVFAICAGVIFGGMLN